MLAGLVYFHRSWVFVDRGLNDSGRLLTAFDQTLNVLHCLRGKELLAGLLAYAAGTCSKNGEGLAPFDPLVGNLNKSTNSAPPLKCLSITLSRERHYATAMVIAGHSGNHQTSRTAPHGQRVEQELAVATPIKRASQKLHFSATFGELPASRHGGPGWSPHQCL